MDGWKGFIVMLSGFLVAVILIYFTRFFYFLGIPFLFEAFYVLYFLASGKDAYFKGKKQTKKDLIGFIAMDMTLFIIVLILVQLKLISF